MCRQIWKLSRIPLIKTKQQSWSLFYKWNKSVGCGCLSGLRNYNLWGEADSMQSYSRSIGVIH
jgi:hypothetical protein